MPNSGDARSSFGTCQTDLNTVKIHFEWKILKFNTAIQLLNTGQKLISEDFGGEEFDGITWNLIAFPNGMNEDEEENACVFLRPKDCTGKGVCANWIIYCITGNQTKHPILPDDNYTSFFCSHYAHGLKIPHSELLLNSDGCFHLGCEVEYISKRKKSAPALSLHLSVQTDDGSSDSCNNLLEPSEKNDFADCFIKVGNDVLPSHRVLLSRCSEVFRKCFSTSSPFARSDNSIRISGFSTETVQAMLDYIYTGETSQVEKNACDVLRLADMYGVLRLKERCEAILIGQITASNVVSHLLLADKYAADNLAEECIKFIMHDPATIETAEFSRLCKERPSVSSRIFQLLYSKKHRCQMAIDEEEESDCCESDTSCYSYCLESSEEDEDIETEQESHEVTVRCEELAPSTYSFATCLINSKECFPSVIAFIVLSIGIIILLLFFI